MRYMFIQRTARTRYTIVRLEHLRKKGGEQERERERQRGFVIRIVSQMSSDNKIEMRSREIYREL